MASTAVSDLRRVVVLAALLLAAAATKVSAQTLPAREIALPFPVDTLEQWPQWLYDPANRRLLTGTNKDGLFASQDGGLSWTRIDDGSFRAPTSTNETGHLVVSPTDALFSLPRSTGKKPILVRSLDGGRSWQPFLDGNDRNGYRTGAVPVPGEAVTAEAQELAFVPGRPDELLLRTEWPYMHEEGAGWLGARLWRSTDGGRHFERLALPPPRPSEDATLHKLHVTASFLCAEFWTFNRQSKAQSQRLMCRDPAKGTWRTVDIGNGVTALWATPDGGVTAIVDKALVVSSDGMRTFRRTALPDFVAALFLHPRDTYPAYLTIGGATSRTLYRLDRDHSLTRLGEMPERLVGVDFERKLAIAGFEEFYRVDLE
jgi:hypothetical protein